MADDMSLGQKIREIRTLQGISQQKLALDTGYTQSRISRIESGTEACDKKTLTAIRKALGIMGMPLLPGERAEYERRLSLFKDYVHRGYAEKALAMIPELSTITKLPFETALNAAFKIIKVALYAHKNDYEAVERILNHLEPDINGFSYEHQFFFHFYKARAHQEYNRQKEAMAHLLQADKLSEKEEIKKLPNLGHLYYNMAVSYCLYGLYFRAIMTLERAAPLFPQDEISFRRIAFDLLLGSCYTTVREYEQAAVFLDNALLNAKSIENKRLVGLALRSLGQLYMKTKRYKAALEFFNEAQEYLEGYMGKHYDGESLENLYFKGYCLVEMKSPGAEAFLREAAAFIGAIGNEKYTLLLESLMCVLKLRENESVNFIVNTTIPYLTKIRCYVEAIDYCDIVEAHLRKKSIRRTNEIVKMANDIYKKMMSGDVI